MNEQVWNRLVRGESLEGLALPLKHGRTDLGNLFAPQPTVRQSIRTPISDVAVLGNTSVVRGAVWESLDFSGSRLDGVRFFDCVVRNCVFDECICQDWRMWSRGQFRTLAFAILICARRHWAARQMTGTGTPFAMCNSMQRIFGGRAMTLLNLSEQVQE